MVNGEKGFSNKGQTGVFRLPRSEDHVPSLDFQKWRAERQTIPTILQALRRQN
jgi:hypothetical protein